MTVFYCRSCDHDFDHASPDKLETIDPVYGSCWKYIASCPQCGTVSNQKSILKHSKRSISAGYDQKQSCCGGGNYCCR